MEVIYVTPPSDGIYEYEFVATPPGGTVIQVLTPIKAHTVRTSIPDDLKGIRVKAASNSVEQPLDKGAEVAAD